MKCPQCGNSELQEHHRYCFQCSCSLDRKPVSTATTLSETSSQQTISQLKSSPTETDGQLLAENSQFSTAAPEGDEENKGLEDQDKQNANQKPVEQVPNHEGSNVCPKGQEEIHLTDHAAEIDREVTEKADAAISNLSQVPASGVADQSAENVLQMKTTAKEMLPLDHDTAQIPKEPEMKQEQPGKNAQTSELQEQQTQTSEISSGENLRGPESNEIFVTAGIGSNTAHIASGSDRKATSQFPDAMLNADQHSQKLKVIQLPGTEKSGVMKQTDDKQDTHDQKHDSNEKSALTFGDKKEHFDLKSIQKGAIQDNGHEKPKTLPGNDEIEDVTTGDEGKPGIQVDSDTEGSHSNPNPSADGKVPVQPTVDFKDSPQMNVDKTEFEGGKTGGEVTNVEVKHDEQTNVPPLAQSPTKHLPPHNKDDISQVARGGKTTEIEKLTVIRDTTLTAPQNDNVEAVKNNKGSSTGQASNTGFITVIFHALLTPTFNINFHQGDRVVLRGQAPFSWISERQVDVHVEREISSGYHVLECKVKLTLRDARRKIAYKYCVIQPQGKPVWECLIGFRANNPEKHVNRCLNIPENSIKDNATWHQYDDAVFSEPSFWSYLRSRIPLLRNVDMDPAEGRRMAMMAVLPDWDRISIVEGGIKAHEALSAINNVACCMSKAEFENGGSFFPRVPYGFDFVQVLYEYLSPRLNLNIQSLQVQAEDEDAQTKRLIATAVIASLVVFHRMTFLRDDELSDLLECLSVIGDPERRRCSGYDAILRHFPREEHKSILADSLRQLCIYVIDYRPRNSNWLFAIPLLHFLSGSAEPFSFHVLRSKPNSTEDNSWWGTQDMVFHRVRRRAETFSTGTPAHLLRQLSPMFEVDALLKRTFLLALPIRDIAKIMQEQGNVFALHEVCWTLARVVQERDTPYLSDEEWASLEQCIKEMYNDLDGKDRVDESQYEVMLSLAEAASHLFYNLLKSHGLAIRERTLVISGIFQLLDKSLLFAKRSSILDKSDLQPSKQTLCNELFQGTFLSLRDSLETQFSGNLFYKSEEWRREEFQVWSTLLSVKIEDKEFQLFWERGVRETLKSRIDLIDQAHVMELYCRLDLHTYHQEIDECFMSAAFAAVDHLVEAGLKEEQMASLSSKLESPSTDHLQASGVSKLFSLLLKRCWPKGTDGKAPSQEEKLQHILSWKPMGKYFKYFGNQSQPSATLPDDGLHLLVSASSLLEHVGLCLRNAEIDVNTLQTVEKNRADFLNLYSLLSEDEGSTESSEKTVGSQRSEVNGSRKKTSTIELFLDMRVDELEAFEKERDAVRCFVEMCSIFQWVDVDLDEIKEKLDKDISSCKMSELCHKRTTSEEAIVKFFGLSLRNKRMIQSLQHIQASLLFRTFWQKCLQKAADLSKDDPGPNVKLTIDKVSELVWKPCNQRWTVLWERIISGEISLKEVKERFEGFQDDQKALDVEIKTAQLECFSNEDNVDEKLHHRINQIKQSLKLNECSDAAETILAFRDAMRLEGDFHVLEDVLDQMNETFHRRTLDDISDDVLEIGRALEQLTKPMADCLTTVINCKEYIFWLQEALKGREEVKTLVDLAMMSAGESDIETDRVSFLHTTALGFAPFIFDLDKDIDFSRLMSLCDSVWKEIKENPTLPEKLEGINSHLEWLKGVKDAHAMSSLTLAQAINERGVYCIGQLDTMMTTTPYDKKTVYFVINLLLPSANDGNASFKTYSLEQLQELQSKLALISGKRSSGQEDVDKFGQILQSVVQLGQAYVNLCEIGDVFYLDWNEEYKCRSRMGKNVVNDIASQTQKFERRYQACKEHINNQRKKYHELNYFTTKQLLFLRKELAAIKNSTTTNVLNLQLYALLEKIAPDIHPSMLQDVFLEAGIMPQNHYYSDVGFEQLSLSSSQEFDYHRAAGEQAEIVKKYETLLSNIERLDYPEAERLAVAALVNGRQSSEAELVIWCVQNHANNDLIDDLYDEARNNPLFSGIVNEPAGSESSQRSEDFEEGNTSSLEDDNDEVVNSSLSEEIVVDETNGGTYLSLEEMGVFLFHLAHHGERTVKRRFPIYVKQGRPNLILARKEHIFPAVLSLYMGDGAQGLPTGDEVLICTSETTFEEVELLWRRALAETGGRLYCLVLGDLLDYNVSQKAVDCLHTLTQDYDNESFGLVVLCSSENEERSHLVAALEEYRVTRLTRDPKPDELRRYLANQFKAPHQRPGSYRDQHVIWSPAADVHRSGNLNVHVVSSPDSGVGKSLVVQRIAEQVENLPNNLLVTQGMNEQNQESPPLCITIPLHDKHARVADVVGFFLPHAIQSDVPLSRIFHLDSSCTVTQDLDTLLFNLLILGELTDDRGRVWRRNPYDLYILEITSASFQNHEKTPTSCRFFELLPTIMCSRPRQTIRHLRKKAQEESPPFDDEEFKSEAVQRVWQYLRRFNEDRSGIQEFCFDAQRMEESPEECLQTLIRNCGVRDPSWAEIRYFVNFLNYQLHDCEQSVYCKPAFIEDTLEGFRIFVVTFMIIMSKDFSLRSLKGEEDLASEETDGGNEENDIRPLQLRRSWEQSTHPYIFFNPDHETLTFLGFQVDEDGISQFLDPQTGEIIKQQLMSRRLRTGLHVQKVDLNNDFESYSKADKIATLCKVMGIEWCIDPDESYELTGDNAKKILAIHMRFRCDIPVVIMGETGCGKTRLIRYMCGLQTGGEKRKNLLLMKIHGGTTFKDIERNVLNAEAMAMKNGQENIDTVLFFDEANTTEALGMIKEIMVDRKCNGRPLSSESNRLKFIVACNPYRSHTDEMIQKLESAGLGYHVKADETTERFGRIPLRHLVYRVHALPESMRSLVWDFGRLQPDVEEKYICQIVRRYVNTKMLRGRGLQPEDEELVNTISKILAVSQQFMGNRKDECSFVSLRDVKRAMEVMVWFYNHYEDFSPLIQNEEEESDDDSSESGEKENEEDEKISDHIFLQKVQYEEKLPTFAEKLSDRIFPQKLQYEEKMPKVEEKLSDHIFPQKFQYKETLSMMEETHSDPGPFVDEEASQFIQETLSDDIDPITWSLILALGVCYHARLQRRDEYREEVARAFRHPCRLPGGPDRIEREITRCQQAVMNQIKLGPNIARNTALSENVFMMVVCIELRIPLFVVGKPGSSKSLAKTVVAENMQGDRSPSDLFKNFKEIQLISYQCSPQSTPEGILATFRQCSELQDRKKAETVSDKFASVVVLDEVGLAEDSPKMPLKTLHPLLEDSDINDDDVIETENSFSRVAFIGLSNWALDPAKMNRGILLSRNEPSENELEGTARGICGDDPDIMPLVEHLIGPVVAAYVDLYKKQKTLKRLQDGKKDEFFGLRDFYSLVKMVFHIAKEQGRSPNFEELEHAIKRNFGGLLEEDFNPVNIIKAHLGFPDEFLQNDEDHLSLDSLTLIKESLDRKSIMGGGRYPLILTENFAALPRVKQLLLDEDKEEPYVIFGSSFPKDQMFTQVCRNINRIKICMETGRTVILLNLENLYESLYDALNQYYVTFGGEKYVDLGLGNHRVKCRVHKDFRLIVIAEKDVVYNKFPIPLINRMEKHFLVMSSGLTEAQKNVTKKLQAWVEDFAEVILPAHERKSRKFTEADAFVGYHEDCVPAVVLQVCAELHEDGSDLSDERKETWEENVLKYCQQRLLQCATPDSVTRLSSSRLIGQAGNLWNTYFREQEHSSLANFLVTALTDVKTRASNGKALRAQISTHSRLLSDRDIPMLAEAVDLPESYVKCVSLQQFQTEQQFCNCIGREFFAKLGGRESLLIVQCDSTDRTLDLVACARHLLIEECREMEKELDQQSIGSSHILMIVQLARVARGCPGFVGVQGEGWLSVHIDDLCPLNEEIPLIQAMTGRSVSKIFESALNKTEDNFTVRRVLTSCVQEAASRIEDDDSTLERATRRVELMINLLSPKPSATLESEGRFEMVVAERLHQLLEQKDQRAPNEGNEWLEAEARSSVVQETGTFKKALWRRFQLVVAPVLAEVIAYVDRDGNLELAASEDSWIVNLWLKILKDSSFTYLHYNDFQEGDAPVVRSKVPVLKSGYHSHSFQCSLPFSWLLKERMDELYRDARSVAANSPESVTECLRKLLNNSEVNAILSEAISEGGEAVVACYLYDFTHMIYKPQDDDELEVVQRAITAAAKEIHNINTSEGRFEMDLAIVHTAYSEIQQRLNWLSLLLQAKPDILPDLLNSFSWDENEMSVDAMALQMCLERMEPQAEDVEETSRRQKWCDAVLSIKIPVEAMIRKAPGGKARMGDKTETILKQCRFMWQRISAVRLFMEHVYSSHADPEDVQTLLKLWKALGDRTDLSKKESLNVIERFLLCCSEDSLQRSQADKREDHVKFLQRCNAFFMDIVSVFCFGEDTLDLDPSVFEMLMRYVVGEELAETKEFSPFPGFGTDNSPVVRSFLLQQLINSSDEKAKKHIERFLYKAQGLSSEVPHVLNVCLLTVQCMETSLASTHAKFSDFDLSLTIGIFNKLCQDALLILEKDFASSDELPVAALEAIAKARYALDKTSEFIYKSVVSSDETWTDDKTRGALNSLFNTVQALCSSGRFRSPALFLLKQLVKRYGVHSIATISQNEELSWIVPAEFQQRMGDGMTLDRFLVYGDNYRKVRDSLAGAILSGNMDELIASLEALEDIPDHAKDVILLLALYREITLPQRTARNQQVQLLACQMVKDVILNRGRFLSRTARHLASALLETSPEKGVPFLPTRESQSEIEKALPEVLLHANSVLECIEFDKLLEPLSAIIRTPRSILDSFLPTMPEDSFHETRSAMTEGGSWYKCPAGHRYFVGDCGRPTQQRDCPDCHGSVAIGGESHQLVSGNILVGTRDDRSNKGHILGAPQKTVAERDLSPAIVSLLRVILHSAMMGGGRKPEDLRQLIVPEVQADDVCGFLWEHLVNDVRNLSISLGRSEDEVLLAIHFVLSELVYRATNRSLEPPECDRTSFWSTKEERRNWEKEFVDVFVKRIWMNLEERLQDFYGVSVNDRRLGNDPLMRAVYEVDAPSPPRTAADIHPGHAAFWKYKTRVTVDLVIRNFQDVKSNKSAYKILGKFLDEEHKLRALRYLPDIVALQRILTDRFHRRIDKEKANQLKIRDFLKDLPKGQKDNASKLFRSFRSAWDLVRHQLSSQGRFVPTKDQCLKTVDMGSTVSLLLPISEGPEVCCKGLTFFLVNAQNEFVQAYHSSGNSRSTSHVSLSEVSASQLIAYDPEKDLLPVMLANCTYSLEVGRETQLQYNWGTLEKQIIDRFIRGKPEVDFSEVEYFMFREDARDDYLFSALRYKIPQEPIPRHVRTQILSELKDLGNVSDAISTLEIAIGFLSTAGGTPEMKISDYCNKILFLDDGKARLKSKKAQQFCSLSNILDLWRTLSLARATLLFKNNQDPFDKVPDCFKTEMPRKVITRFSGALRKVDIELFLSKMIEVISLTLADEENETGEMGLNEYLSRYFEGDDEEFPGLDEIPDDACVKHMIYAWQLALDLSEQYGQRRRSMMT